MEDVLGYLKVNIRFYRKKCNLSQQKLAEMCGLSTFYVSELEHGRKYPSLKTLVNMADVFSIPVYMLLINRKEHRNYILEQFSSDLSSEFAEMLDTLKKKY